MNGTKTDREPSAKPRKPGTFQPGNQVALITVHPITNIPKDRTAKADGLRTDAYVVAKHLGQNIIRDLERSSKKDWNAIRNKVWSWGVAADKVLQGAQDQPSTVNQVNLLFGSVAPALQRAILGKAFDVLRGQPVQNIITAEVEPQPVDYLQATEAVELRSSDNSEQSSGLTSDES